MADSGSSRNTSGRKRSHDDNVDDDPKKQKNRAAARKCREKKVKETEDLKKKNDELVTKNEELIQKKVILERKLNDCINEIRKHRSSGCKLPPNVEKIINSSDHCRDFLPVGTQIIQRQDIVSSPLIATKAESSQDDTDSDYQAEEIQPTVTGLFTGKQFSASAIAKPRSRNPSSRSPSQSPPAPPVSLNERQHMVCHSPCSTLQQVSNRNVNVNGASNLILKPTWHQLHQQTSTSEQVSPGLSPAQLVPNIDSSEWYTVPDTYSKQNGFPDIEEAVQHAQEDPGVMENGCNPPQHQHHHHQNIVRPNESLNSIGFIPNCTTPSSSSASSSEIFGIRNSQQVVSNFQDNLKPPTSSSMTVSMNDTAQLLSQAIYNFDASEISEDLKKQYAELAKSQENKVTQEEPQQNQGYAAHYNGEESTCVAEQYQATTDTQPQAPVANNNEITYDALLDMAKDQQNITVQYQGKEYSCNYEQVKQLLKYVGSDAQVSEENTNNETENYYSALPAPQAVMTNDLLSQANCTSYLGQTQNQVFAPLTDLTPATCSTVIDNSNGIVPMTTQVPVVETPVQATHLPTTVLSMMEEDSGQSQSQSPSTRETTYTETYVDSVDYGANVIELPSLSLTEDHTNIFEKKRRFT